MLWRVGRGCATRVERSAPEGWRGGRLRAEHAAGLCAKGRVLKREQEGGKERVSAKGERCGCPGAAHRRLSAKRGASEAGRDGLGAEGCGGCSEAALRLRTGREGGRAGAPQLGLQRARRAQEATRQGHSKGLQCQPGAAARARRLQGAAGGSGGAHRCAKGGLHRAKRGGRLRGPKRARLCKGRRAPSDGARRGSALEESAVHRERAGPCLRRPKRGASRLCTE